MNSRQKIASLMMILMLHVSLSGCAPTNIRVQTSDKTFYSNKNTKLVAGFSEAEDNRPDGEKENDSRYEKPVKLTIEQKLYRDIKLSGIFGDVLWGRFDEKDVDVIIKPNIDVYYYKSGPNGWTPLMFLLAFTGIPGLIYIVAGGPSGDHNAEASLGLKMTDINGNILAVGKGSRKLSSLANIHNNASEGIGALDGRALSDASYDAITSFALDIKYANLPKPKNTKPE